MIRGIAARLDLAGNGILIAAFCINAFGAGMFAPFSILYVHDVASLSLATIGLVLTSATLLTLAITPLTGSLVDRFGARRLVVLSQILEAEGIWRTSSSTPRFLSLAQRCLSQRARGCSMHRHRRSSRKLPGPAIVNAGMG